MNFPPFVKLTDGASDRPVWINANLIQAVTQHGHNGQTIIEFADGVWDVDESMEQVIEILTNGTHKSEDN